MSARGSLTSTLSALNVTNIVFAAIVSFLLQCGHCEHDCSSSIEASQGPGVSLMINCTQNLLSVTYKKLNTDFSSNRVTVQYTCGLLNNTVIDDEVLIDDSSHPMETRIVTNLTFEHGTVCQVYGCYEYGDSFQDNLLVYDIKPATCTVADVETCSRDCQNLGASGCRVDGGDGVPLGYECVCDIGYVWNETHCENVNECNTTDPQHQHNCTQQLPDSWCVDLEGTFACVQCTEEEEWNGNTCLPKTNDTTTSATKVTTITSATFNITPFTISPATFTESTATLNRPLIAKLPSSGTVGALITFSLITLACLFAVVTVSLFCIYQKKRREKSVHGETNYFGYPYFSGYDDQELDLNFEPLKSIHPGATHQSVSISSNLHYLIWEDSCTATTLTKLQLTSGTREQFYHSGLSESDSCSYECPDSNPQRYGNDELNDGTNDVFADAAIQDCKGDSMTHPHSSTTLNYELESGFDKSCGCKEFHTMTSSSDCGKMDKFSSPGFSTRHQSTKCSCYSCRASLIGERLEDRQSHHHTLDIYGSGFTDQDSAGYIVFVEN